jgi:hypothetical protein
MNKRLKIVIGVSAGGIILLAALWQTLPRWLPRLAAHWLPPGTQLTLAGPLRWQQGALQLPGLSLRAQGCPLAMVGATSLGHADGRWQLASERVSVDTACLARLPAGDGAGEPLSIDKLQQRLPALDVTVAHFTLLPWQQYAGKLQLHAASGGQQLSYQGDNLSLAAWLDDKQQLTLNNLTIMPPGGTQPLHFNGKLTVPLSLDRLPEQGAIQGEMLTPYLQQPLLLNLQWQQQQGVLVLQEKGAGQPLATLPWSVSAQALNINQGQWRWPYAGQPLSGGVSAGVSNWAEGLDAMQISARLNVITAGHNGKGNAVLTLGPGKLSLVDSDLAFRLTGQANFADFSATASIPGVIGGSALNPTLSLQPGSLLRAWGNVSPEMKLEEMRLPLAGVNVTLAGISGRLQAIIRASDSYWGKVHVHLDGKAQNFWPDSGDWQWRYWGRGRLPPLQANWDVAGSGRWQGPTLVLDRLSSGFDRLQYGLVTVAAPRLSLREPLVWQRGDEAPSLGGALQLVAEQIGFSNGGRLPAPVLDLQLAGSDPLHFLLRGQLQARDIGPIKLRGRWDGERLRGEGWWPKQSLTVFQPLLAKDANITLNNGEFYAQAAFSAAREQGFEAGGHWVVKNGGLWLKDGDVSGLDFVLPYRLKDHIWQLGTKQPVALRIAALNNLFQMQNITADLQGSYPYSEARPLTLSNVGVDMLNGHISLSALRLPQHAAAVLKLERIDLSALFTALKPKQFAMSGRVNGELPLYLNDPQWLVRNGWIANAGMLTLRLDKDMADAIGSKNLVSGMAIDWLRYMEINRTQARVDLNNLGELALRAKIEGLNPQKNAKREVILNYSHQENVFQLWRSLRFGDNLQEWLEQALSKSGDQQ